ncbi:translation initiation factor IF-2, partial [Methylobacterium isbiliense]|nr:translation initiation factor IF-2 [Methylobacterium isbiliense]
PAAAPAAETVAAPAAPVWAQPRRAARPDRYRAARYAGGQGATWKTGRDAYGFRGTFGGCRYFGTTGPHGYKLNRSC